MAKNSPAKSTAVKRTSSRRGVGTKTSPDQAQTPQATPATVAPTKVATRTAPAKKAAPAAKASSPKSAPVTAVPVVPGEDDVAESAIRRYFQLRNDSADLVDRDRLSDLQAKLDATSDYVEKLKLQAEIDRESAADADSIRAAFVAHARRYAEANKITATAFMSLGASEEDLRAAGVISSAPRGRTLSRQRRKERVSKADVVDAMPMDPFTVSSLVERSGASIGTVRAVLAEMLEDGRLTTAEGTSSSGRGRAPMTYSLR